jgi:rRNA maturation endonuclease Nob1
MNGSFGGAEGTHCDIELAKGITRTGIRLRVVCAWCGKTTKEGPLPVSHGMCGECGRRLKNEMKEQDSALGSGTA